MPISAISLRLGDRGDAVADLHRALEILERSIDRGERDRRVFGPATEALLREFQAQSSIQPTGVFDADTRAVLERASRDVGPFAVHGRLTDASGSPIVGATILALDMDLRRNEVLGQTTTDSGGDYEVRYPASRLTRAAKEGANLVVRALVGNDTVAESAILFNAPPEVRIDLSAAKYQGPSEFEQLERELLPLLDGMSPSKLVDSDVAFLAGETRREPAQWRAFIQAQQLAATTSGGIPAEVFFACLRRGLPRTWEGVRAVGSKVLRSTLAEALDGNVIPARLRDQIDELVGRISAPRQPEPPGFLEPLLSAHAIDAEGRREVARAWADHPDRGAGFWARINVLDLPAPQVAALKTTVALDELCAGNGQLIQALQAHTPEVPDGTLAHLARLTPNQWIEAAAAAAQPGDTMTAVETAAVRLGEAIERRHASLAFKAKLEAGSLRIAGYPAEKVAGFLGKHTAFDLKATDVEPYLVDHGLADDHELKVSVLKAQRLLRLGASQAEAAVLMNAKLDSIARILARGKEGMAASSNNAIPEGRLASIHDRARTLVSGALGIASTVTPFFNPVSIAALPGPRAAPDALARFPSLGALFGDLSYCECRHCNSVLGPAAYLVDLLRMLTDHGVEHELRRRRPDIAELELSCENTNTEVPYVDLVLEVLENEMTFPGGAWLALSPDDSAQLDANVVPAVVRTELAATVGTLDDPIQVQPRSDQPPVPGAPSELTFRSGTRRWVASRWREQLFAAGATLPVPAADLQAALQALRAGQVSPALLTVLAPEPELPVSKTPTVTSPGGDFWTIALVREVAITFVSSSSVGAMVFKKKTGEVLKGFQLEVRVWQLIAADLNAGRVSDYLANLLPPKLAYRVQFDATAGHFLLTADVSVDVQYALGSLRLLGLTYSAGRSGSDPIVIPENRNPRAYVILREARYPRSLPFDVFLEEVRACLSALGVSRAELIRTLKPFWRHRALDDASETFQTASAQLELIPIEGTLSPAQSAALWGLEADGNVLSDPSGDPQAGPIPTHWVDALSRLSILLERSRLKLPALRAAWSSRYVTGGTAAPQLDPAFECRPSRITVKGLDQPRLDRLQQLLRLHSITGWAIRDLDAVIQAVTTPTARSLFNQDQLVAISNLHELSRRFDLPLRQVAVWMGALETVAYQDHELDGAPMLPSLYDEIFLKPQIERSADADLVLDASAQELAYLAVHVSRFPTTLTLTQKLPELSRALGLAPAELRRLIDANGASHITVPDRLTLAELVALYQRVSFARALGISIAELVLLSSCFGGDLFLAPAVPSDMPAGERTRRLLDFADMVESVRASGFSFDELAQGIGAEPLDMDASRERGLDQVRWLVDLQARLKSIAPAEEADVSEPMIRGLLAAAGWLPVCVDRLLLEAGDRLSLGSTAAVQVTVVAATAPTIPPSLPFVVSAGPHPGEWSLGVILERFATVATREADALFESLAAISGLGPITDATSPAAVLRTRWRQLEAGIQELARWLQSIELPRFATPMPLVFKIEAPQPAERIPAELAPRVSYARTGELLIHGFLSEVERLRMKEWAKGSSNTQSFGAAVDALPAPPAALSSSTARLQFDDRAGTLTVIGYLDAADVASISALVGEPQSVAAIEALARMSEAFVERRPGQRWMDEAQVKELILVDRAGAQRLARLHTSLVRLMRRRLAERAASERMGVDPPLFMALDGFAQRLDAPTDVLGPLCSEELVSAALPGGVPWSALVAASAIDRVGLILRRLKVRASEAPWFDPSAAPFTGLSEIGFGQPADDLPARFLAWQRTVALFRLRDGLPGQAATLEAIRASTALSRDHAFEVIERAFGLTSASEALRLEDLIVGARDLLDPLKLREVIGAARLLRRLAAEPAILLSLCATTLGEAEARAARGAVIAKLGTAAAGDGLREASNRLREKQRAALVEYLMHRDRAVDSADLHARYLLDVEMGSEMRTSRIKQAISSTQLFIQRWLMNLESASLPGAGSEVARRWEWMKSYRVWEANRKVFLFPENWLEPSLRDDKSHLFRRFESSLLQSEVTSDRAIESLRQYLDGLEEISRMTVVAMYCESQGPRAGTVHMVGKTAHEPVKYFYRQWEAAGAMGSWQPWQPVEALSNTDHVVVFVRNGRPRIAWLQVDKAQSGDLDDIDPNDQTPRWAVGLQWIQLEQTGWSAPRKSRNKISHIKPINKDPSTAFALRVEAPDARSLVIRCYGGSMTGGQPTPDPIPWGANPVLTSTTSPFTSTVQMFSVQVLGKFTESGPNSQTRYVPLEDARVEVSAGGTPTLPFKMPFLWGPWTLSNRQGICESQFTIPSFYDVFVNFTVKFPGERDQTNSIPSFSSTLNHNITIGFVFDVDGNKFSEKLNALRDPKRKLRLYPLATGSWGLGYSLQWTREWQQNGVQELLPQGDSEHYSSGFRFPPGVWVDGMGRVASENAFLISTTHEGSSERFPFYIETESSAAAGFVVMSPSGTTEFLPASEVTHMIVQQALDMSSDELALPSSPPDAFTVDSTSRLVLNKLMASSHDRAAPQFDRVLPYATYDWEIFFHVPIMVAGALATHQRYAEALRWLHLVFDPTRGAGGPGDEASSFWRFPPFAKEGQGVGIDVLLEDFSANGPTGPQAAVLKAQIDYSRKQPFRPHGIARMRTRAYQWMTVLKYLDVLIAWGDHLFKRDTIEAINEATQLYLLAGELLGRRPLAMPEQSRLLGTPTYASLAGRWDDFSNAWLTLTDLPFFKAWLAWLEELERTGVAGPRPSGEGSQLQQLASIGSLVFCVPRNDKIDSYWDTVEDRLFKIRHSQNIDGVARRLALFEPPIDPALLVRAVAAGIDIDSLLDEVFAPASQYRFSVALQRAMEFCNEVKALGGALLAAWEKHDGEAMARLRATQEIALLDLVAEVKRRQLDEAEANLRALRQTRSTAEVRYRHYQRLLGKEQIQVPKEQQPVTLDAPRLQIAGSTSDRVDAQLRGFGLTLEESDHLEWLVRGNNFTRISGGIQLGASIAHALPSFSWTIAPGPWSASMSMGGSNLGYSLGAVAQIFSALATEASFQANRSSIIGGHQRRYDDWALQSNLAAKELEQIDKQILTAEIRVEVARREIVNHQKQIENAQSIDVFLREKFSKQELYQWMTACLTEAHSTLYHFAYDLAKRAERASEFELGVSRLGIINFGAWDSMRGGLLAGERLSIDLKRLEAAHLERNRRELEITKHISLSDLDPLALLRLQTTGVCEFDIPELVYDLDFPGHYFRRLRTVSVSIPCVAGPYTSVAGTLSLLRNRMRIATGGNYPYAGLDDKNFVHDLTPIQSVALSSGQNDAGLFELNFRDERYLPFEGAGAISAWRFELPTSFAAFDYSTISDLVMHVRYTARDGGGPLKGRASAHVRAALQAAHNGVRVDSDDGRLVRVFSLRRDFSAEWSRLIDQPGKQAFVIDLARFPYMLRDQAISIWKVGAFIERSGEDDASGGAALPLRIYPPRSAYTGPDPQPELPLSRGATGDGLDIYQCDLSASPDWRPVSLKPGTAGSWQIAVPPGQARYRDIVLALWWKLGQIGGTALPDPRHDGDGGHDTPVRTIALVQVAAPQASLFVGDAVQATASVKDSSGAIVAFPVAWITSNAAVATVSPAGLITAVGPGAATITATAGAVSGVLPITAAIRPAAIRVTPSSYVMADGLGAAFSAVALDALGQPLPAATIDWAVADGTAAQFKYGSALRNTFQGPNVIVHARKDGLTTLTASSGGVSATVQLDVRVRTIVLVQVYGVPTSLIAGDVVQADVSVKDNSAAIVPFPVAWTTSNAAVATVSPAGLITAVGHGAATITATSAAASGILPITVAPGPAVVTRGLIGWWRFDELSGTTVKDWSDLQNHGKLNDPNQVRQAGKIGNSLTFNGTSDHVDIPVNGMTFPGRAVTLSVWTYGDASLPTATGYGSLVVSAFKTDGDVALTVCIPYTDGSILFRAGSSDGADTKSTGVLQASQYKGQWNHWVFTKDDGGLARIYLNGSLLLADPNSGSHGCGTIATFRIGKGTLGKYDASSAYKGMLDEIRLYNYALSATDVTNLYRADSTKFSG